MRIKLLSVSILPVLAFCFIQPKPFSSRVKHSGLVVLRSNPVDEFNWDPSAAPKLDFDECYYEVLEVSPKADQEGIKKAFYRLVTSFHPDSKDTDEDKNLANKQMMVLNNAYKILKDIKTREEYDAQLRRGMKGAAAGIKGAAVNSFKRRAGASRSPRRGYTTTTPPDSATPNAEPKRKRAVAPSMDDAMFDSIADYVRQRERMQEQAVYEDDYLSTAMKKEKASALRRLVSQMEQELGRGDVDWGEVTDQRRIERRLRDLAALNAMREQLIDLEYEITAEDEETEFRRRGESFVSSYSDSFDSGDTPFGFSDLNSRSPWRQNVEKRRYPQRSRDNSGNEAVIEELERLRRIK